MKRWDVYWANVPYEDAPEQKKTRPVVICIDKTVYALVIKVTSQQKRKDAQYDYQLAFWKECGLTCPSVVRVDKLSKLTPDAFGDYIGRLHPADIIEIQKLMVQYTNKK